MVGAGRPPGGATPRGTETALMLPQGERSAGLRTRGKRPGSAAGPQSGGLSPGGGGPQSWGKGVLDSGRGESGQVRLLGHTALTPAAGGTGILARVWLKGPSDSPGG